MFLKALIRESFKVDKSGIIDSRVNLPYFEKINSAKQGLRKLGNTDLMEIYARINSYKPFKIGSVFLLCRALCCLLRKSATDRRKIELLEIGELKVTQALDIRTIIELQ